MEYHLNNKQRIALHRNKEDYEAQHIDCLQFAYGDRRYVKMTDQIANQEDVLKIKNLQEIMKIFKNIHRADIIAQCNLQLEKTSIMARLNIFQNRKNTQ